MPREKPKKEMTVRTLQELDLVENEAILYTHMITCPQSTVQELGVQTSFPRTMLYHILKQLIRRGLVSTKKEGWRTVYIAEDPEHLYDLLAKKEQVFEKETNTIRELIPCLKNQYRLAGIRPTVRIFEGVEEYKKALEDIIISNPREIYAYEVFATKKPAKEIRETNDKQRVVRKISKKVLFFNRGDALRTLGLRPYDDFTQFRSIKEGSVALFDTDLTLYDGKLLYTSYYDEHEPTAILVEDKALYLMQKNLFDTLWKQGKNETLIAFD